MTTSRTWLFEPTPTTTRALPMATVARGLAAGGVLLSADVHLDLYFSGFSSLNVIGPAFMLNAIGGFVIALAVLTWRHPIPVVLAIGFGIATLTAFYISASVGLFGVRETWGGTQVVLAEISEWLAIVAGGVALAVERPTSRR